MTLRWIKCCDDFYPIMQKMDEAFTKAGFIPAKPISHCPFCGHPITVEGEPDTPFPSHEGAITNLN